jgi:hypothetical protein
MKITFSRSSILVSIATLAGLLPAFQPAAATDGPAGSQVKQRVIVLTDIGSDGDPDDAESMVRFLLYTNQFEVEGLIAASSIWRRDGVNAAMIEQRVRAYGTALPNLRRHATGYPDTQQLLERIKQGQAAYGMQGVGAGKDTAAAELIIAAVDRADPRPVWITLWGGAVDLAQAIWKVRQTRSAAQLAAFIAKLRVYSISDQDDAGPWLRRTFPDLFWIVSVHAFGDYPLATWTGMSGDLRRPSGGPDTSLVNMEWIDRNIRKGPLGSLYPPFRYVVEGDTPSFLGLIDNGLNVPEHPEYGGWGGRYGKVDAPQGLYADAADTVIGKDGKPYRTNQATVWRWRQAVQNDFATRIDWTTAASFKQANHQPSAIVNGLGGTAPITISAHAGETVSLSASGSSDPDSDALVYRWWNYQEAANELDPPAITLRNPDAMAAEFVAPQVTEPHSFHIMLEVQDAVARPLTSYRRVIVNVRP